MSQLQYVLQHCLQDRRITPNEVAEIRRQVERDGRLDLEDVKFLVTLLTEANDVCPEFDDLFFPILKAALLHDGAIGQDEQFYLLKMLYADGQVRDREKQFLAELRNEAISVSPQFDQLCETALAASGENWDLGGK